MNRHHPVLGARLGDEPYVRERIKRARWIHGVPYTLDFNRRLGREATFFITFGTDLDAVDNAVVDVKSRLFITSSLVLLVPPAWLGTQIPQGKNPTTYPQEE